MHELIDEPLLAFFKYACMPVCVYACMNVYEFVHVLMRASACLRPHACVEV